LPNRGGGFDTGWSVRDTCYDVDSPQEMLNCRVVNPFKAQTQITSLVERGINTGSDRAEQATAA